MKVPIIKLGTECVDTATGLMGTLTLAQIGLDGKVEYAFQPPGLQPENGQPIKGLWIEPIRIQERETLPTKEVDVPMEILGTEVRDRPTGFMGTAVCFFMHINGCFHVNVQPKGKLEKSGSPAAPHDFDIRRLMGKAVPVLTEEALTKSHAATPSPGDMPEREERPI